MAEEPAYVPYGERPEWADVTPVAQDDGAAPVCTIAYTDEFRDAMDYFRAVLAADERSERALALTGDIVNLNAANYTAWHFRRLCLDATGADLRQELAFADEVGGENPKNYQIWYHRRLVCERLGEGVGELEYTARVFREDAKNYHAWSHRQWVLQTFGLLGNIDGTAGAEDHSAGAGVSGGEAGAAELAFVSMLLTQDVRNNSAWNQRWFVIAQTTAMDVAVAQREIAFGIRMAKVAIDNEAAWNYVEGHVQRHGHAAFPNVREQLLELSVGSVGAACVPLLRVLLGFHEADVAAHASGDAGAAALEAAAELVDRLAHKLDTVRQRWWLSRLATVVNRAEMASDSADPSAMPRQTSAGTEAGIGMMARQASDLAAEVGAQQQAAQSPRPPMLRQESATAAGSAAAGQLG